jgi:hypothetical protein
LEAVPGPEKKAFRSTLGEQFPLLELCRGVARRQIAQAAVALFTHEHALEFGSRVSLGQIA